MVKKELLLFSQEALQTIMCDDVVATEYDVSIALTSKKHSQFIFWITDASKKFKLTVNSHVSHTFIEITIFVKAQQNAHHQIAIYQNHTAHDTHSSCIIKGIAYDTSTIEYQGFITLEKESLNTHAEQRSKFLIMSETATVRSVPSLQVHHNQVQCNHATTISYIDPLVLWYSEQRGIKNTVIEHIIEKTFFG